MKPVPLGIAAIETIPTDAGHTAAAVGNFGVAVVATTTLILFIEETTGNALKPYLDFGEASVGTRVEVDHLAALAPGQDVTVRAEVIGVDGRLVTFAVEVKGGGRLLMQGRHVRAIVDLQRFLEKQGLAQSA
ncbi:MAG: hotdog domain-containing protein [Dongiaceae bacterium]